MLAHGNDQRSIGFARSQVLEKLAIPKQGFNDQTQPFDLLSESKFFCKFSMTGAHLPHKPCFEKLRWLTESCVWRKCFKNLLSERKCLASRSKCSTTRSIKLKCLQSKSKHQTQVFFRWCCTAMQCSVVIWSGRVPRAHPTILLGRFLPLVAGSFSNEDVVTVHPSWTQVA